MVVGDNNFFFGRARGWAKIKKRNVQDSFKLSSKTKIEMLGFRFGFLLARLNFLDIYPSLEVYNWGCGSLRWDDRKSSFHETKESYAGVLLLKKFQKRKPKKKIQSDVIRTLPDISWAPLRAQFMIVGPKQYGFEWQGHLNGYKERETSELNRALVKFSPVNDDCYYYK